MKIYINDRNELKIDSKSSDILFLNRYGRRLTRSMIFKIISDASKRIGLDKKIKSSSNGGVPVLNRIPVLKWFFGKQSKENKKSELTIFIRPTVIQ